MVSIIILNYISYIKEEWFDFDRLQILNAKKYDFVEAFIIKENLIMAETISFQPVTRFKV